jgi:hypothetical protein
MCIGVMTHLLSKHAVVTTSISLKTIMSSLLLLHVELVDAGDRKGFSRASSIGGQSTRSSLTRRSLNVGWVNMSSIGTTEAMLVTCLKGVRRKIGNVDRRGGW